MLRYKHILIDSCILITPKIGVPLTVVSGAPAYEENSFHSYPDGSKFTR